MAELTTFAQASNNLEKTEIAQPTPPPDNITPTNPIENIQPTTPVTENVIVPEPPVGEPTERESPIDTSSFSLSLGEEQETPTTTPSVTSQQPTYNWKDEIKKIDRKELMSELGFDSFALELDQHIKGGGQPLDYLQARAIDYTKIGDDALLKDSLRKEYPNLSPAQIDLMFNRKYNVPEDASDEDREFYTAQLQADAYKVRQTKIAEQQRFKISETPIPQKDEAYEQWKQNKEQQVQKVEQVNNFYLNHPATKSLHESKRVTLNLGDGVAPFNFNIDKPEMITNFWTDDGSIFRKLTTTPQGEPDMVRQQKISLFSYNPDKYTQEIFNYGLRCGQQKLVEEGQNAQKPQAKVATMTSDGQTVTIGKYGNAPRT